jgi:2-polyprenyl-6-methoxyphenol hydroxylase-like FAD-dependent oxidoreductase
MAEEFDVVVVGGRCAGAPLAALLAAHGLSVAVVEQATFPSSTLSSHIFEADALAFLDRLGLTEKLRKTGAPFAKRVALRLEDVYVTASWPQRPGDVGGVASIRRERLDPLLTEAAGEAGAKLRFATKVTGLLEEGGRVVGVRTECRGEESELRAALVVGADGRNSTVAKLSGARRYNVSPNERSLYWGYFEGADMGPEPTFLSHRWGDRFVLSVPADDGLLQVLVWPEMSDIERFDRDLDAVFADQIESCAPVAAAVAGARRVGKLVGAVRWEGFFREASGPGWVLLGDAGHFKDPAPGRGIGDAFLQADSLAPAIAAGLDGSGAGVDPAMKEWGRWRDREFAEHYWLATDLGKAGTAPVVLVKMIQDLVARDEIDLFLEFLSHRISPSELVTPGRVLGAIGSLMAERGGERMAILREVWELGTTDARRRWLNRRPAYTA